MTHPLIARWRTLHGAAGSPADACPWLLICPFAGASHGAFSGWRDGAGPGMPAYLATYPGRDRRMSDVLRFSIAALAQELAADIIALPPASRQRLVLAGHSMGAQVAFEAVLLLEAEDRAPAGLVLSGCQAPHLAGRRLLSHLDDDAFVRELAAIGGCSAALAGQPELLALFLPMLRADFTATETYFRPLEADRKRTRSPVLLLAGTRDTEADAGEVRAWSEWSEADCLVRHIAGDHFYAVLRPRAFCRHVMDFHRQCVA
jgi:thioesterase component of yersiniabactin synthetase